MEIGRDEDQGPANGADDIASQVQPVHPVEFFHQDGGEHQADNQGDVDGPGEDPQEIFVPQDKGHVEDTHVQGGTVDLHQDVGEADHQIVAVCGQQPGGVRQGVFLRRSRGGVVLRQLLLGQLLHRQHREGVGHQADDGVDDGHPPPAGGPASQSGYRPHGDRLDEQAGAEGEDKADGAHLYPLGAVFGDQGGESGVGDVIGGVEHGVEQSVGDEEPGVFGKVAQVRRDEEDGRQGHGTAHIAPEHPGPGLAHSGVGLVDHGAEEDVGHPVEELGHGDEGANDA